VSATFESNRGHDHAYQTKNQTYANVREQSSSGVGDFLQRSHGSAHPQRSHGNAHPQRSARETKNQTYASAADLRNHARAQL